MPNEFKIRNGLVVEGGSTTITGSLIVTGGITGSLSGGGSAFPFTGSANITGSLGVIGPSTFSGSVGIADNLTLSTGGFIYGNTTNPYIQLNNSLGSKLGFGSDSYVDVGGPTTIVNANTNIIRFRNNRIVATQNTIIGTSDINDTPTARLHVRGAGATSSTTALRIENSNTTASLVVRDDGWIGIGTATPTTQLEVFSGSEGGTIKVSNSIYSSYWTQGNSFTTTLGFSNSGKILWNTNTMDFVGSGVTYRIENGAILTNSVSGSFLAGRLGTLGFQTYGSTTRYNAIGNVYTDNSTSGLALFYKSASVDIEGMRLTSIGRVGIGTTNPNYLFDVNGQGRFNNSGGGYTIIGNTSANATAIDITGFFTSAGAIRITNSNNGATASIGDYFNTFNTYGTITRTSGTDNINQIGIAPTYNFSNTYVGTLRGIYYNPALTSMTGVTHRAIETTSGDVLFRSGSATLLLVSGSGNVGIGTDNPSARLHIVNTTQYLFNTTNLQIASSGVSSFYSNNAINWSSALTFTLQRQSGLVGLSINNSDNVGIGTTAPTQKLDVSGSIRVRSGFGYTSDFSGGVLGISILNVDGSDNVVIGSTYAPKNVMLTSGIRYDFASTGLGINVTSPTARLHVRGAGATSSTTSLLVQNSNASASLIILDNGNVGIGAAGAAKTLDVVGQMSVVDSTNSTVVGYQSMDYNTGQYNTAFGYRTLFSNTTGQSNTAIGFTSLYSNSTGVSNISIGNATLRQNTSGSYNIGIGNDAVRYITTGSSYNIGIGHAALAGGSNPIFTNNTAIGSFALTSNIIGNSNTAFGYASLYSSQHGSENTALGASTLYSNISGSYNVAVGNKTLELNTLGSYNIGIGYRALTNNRVGGSNIGLGYFAIQYNISGSENIGIGNYSLWNVTGSTNIGIGQYAGAYTVTGSNSNTGSINSIFLGYNSRTGQDNATNEIVIGHTAWGNGSNSVTLGNDSITKTILKGNVGIGTSSPSYQLHVSGSGVVYASNRFIGAGGVAADPTFATISTIAGIFEPAYANLGFSSYGGEAGRIEGASRLWNIGMTGGTARFNIRGTGATSATTALLIQNSTPSGILTVLDDGSVTSDLVTSTSAFNVRRIGTPTTRLISLMANGGIRAQSFWGETGANASGDDGVWSFQSRNRRAADSGSVSGMLLQQEFVQEQFGQVAFNALKIIPTIATSNTANNLTIRGLYYEPFLNTTTGVTAHRAIETTAGDVLFRSGSATLLLVSGSGRVGIGTTTPTFNLDVSGSGRFTDNLTVTGSVTATTGFTGSLFGTASFALSASWAPSTGGGSAFPFTGNALISGSLTLIGNQTITGSLSQGLNAEASGVGSHAEGEGTFALGNYSHAEGLSSTTPGFYAHAEGNNNTAWGQASHAEGSNTYAYGDYSHTEGAQTIASGSYSHAEGQLTTSSGSYSHAEGESTLTIGQSSHAEGANTITEGNYSHAEGNSTQAFGTFSHAEGINTQTIGEASHAEGNNTIAFGNYSHAEGESTVAFGNYSHAEGEGTIASGSAQTVMGRFNTRGNNTSLVVIGNGSNDSNRSNLVLFNQNNVVVSSSLNVTSGITGSLFGTASFALSASWAPSTGGGASFPFTGSAIISGSLIVTGSISNNVLSGSDSRVLVATSAGTLEATNQVIIQTYIDPNGTEASLLNTTSNWNVSGSYIGTTITGTYQGQKHYNTTYFFEAVDDNVWIRLLRV